MKGAIYVLLPILAILVTVGFGSLIILRAEGYREASAYRNARWESYSSVQGGGFAEVGVRLVARWGRHEKTLKSEEMVRVRVDDLSSTALAEAQNEADLRASSYNLLR